MTLALATHISCSSFFPLFLSFYLYVCIIHIFCTVYIVYVQHWCIRVCDYWQIFAMQNTNRLLNAYFIVHLIHIFATNEIDCRIEWPKRWIRMHLTFINLNKTNFNMFERCPISIVQQIIRCPKYLSCSETVTLRSIEGIRLNKLDQNDATIS